MRISHTRGMARCGCGRITERSLIPILSAGKTTDATILNRERHAALYLGSRGRSDRHHQAQQCARSWKWLSADAARARLRLRSEYVAIHRARVRGRLPHRTVRLRWLG